MKKIQRIWKLQAIGLIVILVSIFISSSIGVAYSQRNMTCVLGASIPTNTNQAVSSVVDDIGYMQISSGYELVILVAILLLAIFMIRQFVVIVQSLGSDKNFGLGNIMKIVILDIIIFVLTVAGLASCNVWLINKEISMNTSYELQL